MFPDSLSVYNWREIVEHGSPEKIELSTETPLLYISDLERAKTFYNNFYSDLSQCNFKNENKISLHMVYRGCRLSLNKQKQFEFDGTCPTLTSNSSPFIFYVYTENKSIVIKEAIKYGFKILPANESVKNFELMVFLVVCS